MSKLEFEYLGPYHVQKLIGRGGMGSVYQGLHTKSGEPVAIKVIANGIANQPRFRRRFAAEIEALKRLKHPNIVSLIGYGEEQGMLFYSMEYVVGQSLHDVLRARQKLSWQDVVQIGIEVTSALKHAHNIGIIHRDLKPANLMMDASGAIKLTDFGIAKLFGSTDETAVGAIVGTADYMPPEQAEGKAVTVRSDLYSLGCVLYALLAGRPPFAGKTVPEVLYAVRYTPAPDLSKTLQDVPTELIELVHQLLEKSPQSRPPTALVVGNRLKSVLQALGGKPTLGELAKPSSPATVSPPSLTSYTAIGKKLTSLDMDDEEVDISQDQISELGRNSATIRSDETRDRPTLIASASMLRKAALTGRDDPKESELSSEHISASPETSQRADVTNASILTSVGPSHFTPVTASDTKSFTMASSHSNTDQSRDWTAYLSVAGLVLAIVSSIVFVWWKLQPESADNLYSSILAAVESGDDAQFLAASQEVEQFLVRFPEDERAVDVKAFKAEADFIRRVKILQRKAARSGGPDELSAAEQAFLDAIQARSQDYHLGQEKLAAMISLFSSASLDASDGKLIELAQYAREVGTTAVFSKEPMAKAQLSDLIQNAETAMTAEKLQRFYENVTLLYADKPWAKEQIARIRQKMKMEQ